MSTRWVELVGGPRDGERTFASGSELRVPMMERNPKAWWVATHPDSPEARTHPMRVGVYRSHGKADEMHWQGEQ